MRDSTGSSGDLDDCGEATDTDTDRSNVTRQAAASLLSTAARPPTPTEAAASVLSTAALTPTPTLTEASASTAGAGSDGVVGGGSSGSGGGAV